MGPVRTDCKSKGKLNLRKRIRRRRNLIAKMIDVAAKHGLYGGVAREDQYRLKLVSWDLPCHTTHAEIHPSS